MYFPFIDGLRAIAVLSVLLYHVDPNLVPGGFVGVDIFFVISGFVVSHSVSNFQGSFFTFLTEFYARRCRRILPALFATLLVSALLTVLFVPRVPFTYGMQKAGRAAHFGLSNWILIKESIGYFSTKAELNPFTHTWSLGIEEQFYLLFPLLFFFSLRPGRGRIFSNILYGFLCGISLLIAVRYRDANPTLGFYSLQSRFWELALGILSYRLYCSGLLKARLHWEQTAAVLGIMVALTGTFFTRQNSFPDLWLLGSTLATAAILAILAQSAADSTDSNIVSRLLSLKPMRLVGSISYSLYLVHWPVVVLLKWTWGLENLTQKLTAFIISLCWAYISYRFIETYFQKAVRIRALGKRSVIAAGFVAAVFSQWTVGRMFRNIDSLSFSSTVRNADIWLPYVSYEEDQPEPCGPNQNLQSEGNRVVETFDLPEGCRKRSSPMPHVFVVGDSHARAYGTMLRTVTTQYEYPITLMSNAGCPILRFNVPREYIVPECRHFLQHAREVILQEGRPGDIVFLPALRVPRLPADGRTGLPEIKPVHLLDNVIEEAQEDIAPFVNAGMTVILEGAKPVFQIQPFRCLDWFNKSNPACSTGFEIDRDWMLSYRAPVQRYLAAAAAGRPNVVLWDPFPDLCPSNPRNVCSAVRDGKPIVFDEDHLSRTGNLLLVDSFGTFLDRIISK